MAADDERRGFFAYYREYAKSGVHAAAAAALTALIGVASFTGIRWFVVVAIAVYVLPPVFLYFTGEGDRVPSVVDEDDGGTDAGSGSEQRGNDRTTHESDTDPVESPSDRDTDPDTEPRSETHPDDSGSTTDDRDRRPQPTATASGSADGPTTTDPVDESESEAEHDEREADGAVEPDWETVDTPTDESLLDVVSTPEGAYAVGESGVVLTRDADGWTVALDDGPTANANPLRGVDATTDGGAVWFAGDSGVLGRYADGRLTDHSAPEDQTSTWTDVAVTGEADDERIHLVNGSGELLRGTYDDGRVSWDEIEKPGSGSSISSIVLVDDDRGYLCDTNQGVYETTDGGGSYERIGIDDANAAFTGVAAAGSTVTVSCDDGAVVRYDGSVWTRLRAAETTLSGIDLSEESGLAVGDAGRVVELVDGSWEVAESPTDADLSGVVVGQADAPDLAVGTDGTVVERRTN